MRWLFLLLLLMNVGLFVWQHRLAPSGSSELPLLAGQAERAPVQAVQGLTLMAEAESSKPQSQASVVADSAAHCLVLGGFDAPEPARQLEQRLLSLDVGVRVVTSEASFGADHWVYIPPLASRQASLRQLRELQARGIDSYLITEGELADGILLGVFPRLDSAVSVAEKLRAAGYEPQVRELPRIYQEYWVRVARKSQRLVDDAMLARLSVDFIDLKHQLISCGGLRSAE
ncbi:hypothetical protein D3C78_758460 [compost metagenome]